MKKVSAFRGFERECKDTLWPTWCILWKLRILLRSVTFLTSLTSTSKFEAICDDISWHASPSRRRIISPLDQINRISHFRLSATTYSSHFPLKLHYEDSHNLYSISANKSRTMRQLGWGIQHCNQRNWRKDTTWETWNGNIEVDLNASMVWGCGLDWTSSGCGPVAGLSVLNQRYAPFPTFPHVHIVQYCTP
jgi:hypothetical protein